MLGLLRRNRRQHSKTPEPEPSVTYADLPREVWGIIIGYLPDEEDLRAVSETCRWMRDIVGPLPPPRNGWDGLFHDIRGAYSRTRNRCVLTSAWQSVHRKMLSSCRRISIRGKLFCEDCKKAVKSKPVSGME